MATFILTCFVVFILAFIAKLIYDVQQNKKQDKEIDELCKTEAEFELKDKFQKLAGITENDVQKGTDHLTEKIETLRESFKDVEFPAQSESIPVQSFPITKIQVNQSTDPLSEIPLSRVSKEGKEKMAEIAKQDISQTLEENASKMLHKALENAIIDSIQKELKTKQKKKSAKPKATKAAPKKKKENE